jgi:NAD(P)-dependent dehydrogenase (short-subunit alcohol dehydrogenase family)
MKKDQHHKTAIITGGASGLGFAIAKSLSRIISNQS